jgi:hypothetical protein
MNAHETHQGANLTASPAGVASVPMIDPNAVLADGGHQQARRYAGGVLPHCEHCGEAWLGDAETGGCPAALLAREVVALLEGLLREVEWGDEQPACGDIGAYTRCPLCKGVQYYGGHAPGCRLAAALAAGG